MIRDVAAELRAAFDRAFAEPEPGARGEHVELLHVRVGGEPHVIPLAEVSSLHADLRITPVPGAPELLGIAAVGSTLVAVHDLRVLLGMPAIGAPRWTVVAGGLGFAFEAFDGHARAARLPTERVIDLRRWRKDRADVR